MTKRILLTMLLCVGSLCASSQSTVFVDLLDKNQYQARVKMVDEFFARFNGEEKRANLPAKDNNRLTNILLLFDLSKYKSKQDKSFIQAQQFAQHVVATNTRLKFEDSKWYAKIKCNGTLGAKKVSFDMFLAVEEREKGFYRWAICDVEGSLFLNSRDKPHRELFIMPNEHEQFFQSVRKTTKETYQYIDDYVKTGYKADALSTFLALVRSNYLKISSVSDVEFVLLQVPGYAFTVKYFERQNHNVGWLIDSFKKMADKEKNVLLKRIHQ